MLMVLLLASLAMGLGAILAFYFIMWANAPQWPPPDTPPLPIGLWLSTALIVSSSITMHLALAAAKRGAGRRLTAMMLFTLLLAMAFIVSQVVNWWLAYAAQMPPDRNMYALTFYLLTGLHGLHIVGGLIPLTIVSAKAAGGRYTPDNHAGVGYCAMYWHFVDVVWLVMFVSLLVAG